MNPSNLIESYEDPTGQMSAEGINAANISNLIDAVNGLQASTGNIINQPTYVEVNDGTSNRVLMGYNQTTGTWGLFTTPPGTGIENATQPGQFSSTSDYPSLLVLKTVTGNYSITTASGSFVAVTQTVSIPHGQTTVPFGLCFTNANSNVTGGTGTIPTPFSVYGTSNPNLPDFFATALYVRQSGVDATNFYFEAGLAFPSSSLNGTITVYILQITA